MLSLVFLVFFILAFIVRMIRYAGDSSRIFTAIVVVLGDIGHSPRMQYHAVSLASRGYTVHMVGYTGSQPNVNILRSDKITLHRFSAPSLKGDHSKVLYLCFAAYKLMYLFAVLVWKLIFSLPIPDAIIVQNPPSIPTLFVLYMASTFYKVSGWLIVPVNFMLRIFSKTPVDIPHSIVTIDWHNYGYTISSLRFGKQSVLIKLLRWYENFFGKRSNANLCVSKAMSQDLKENWGIDAVVAYDRPPIEFHRIESIDERHIFFRKQRELFAGCQLKLLNESCFPAAQNTLFTYTLPNGRIGLRSDRPVLIMSSTSWTPDEDFEMLLDAMKVLDSDPDFPKAVVAVTGKGPLHAFYKAKIDGMKLTKVAFILPWLEAEAYPVLLGCADVGVCLHTSSSGLDLPMKVVDMFGCTLPVCAVDYPTIHELVIDGSTGLLFTNSRQLVLNLKFPVCPVLEEMRKNIRGSFKSWDENWNKSVKPVLCPGK